jgi:uncharacterized protein (DUF2147 family)
MDFIPNTGSLMRLTTLPVIGAAAFLGAHAASALSAQDVFGVWRNPDNGSLIQIYPCDGSICAKIVLVPDATIKDVKNPDPALRGRPLVGIDTWRHAKETAPLQWSGSAYNPLDGATVYGTLHLASDAALVEASCNLEVMPCFERTWTKVSAEKAGVFTTLVSQSEPFQPETGQSREASATGKIAAAKPRLPYVYKARKRKEPNKIKAGSLNDTGSYDFLSRLQVW